MYDDYERVLEGRLDLNEVDIAILERSKDEVLDIYRSFPLRIVLKAEAFGIGEDGPAVGVRPDYDFSTSDSPVTVLVAHGTSEGEAHFYLQAIAGKLREYWFHLPGNVHRFGQESS